MNLEIFRNNRYQIRGGLINDEPYFVLADIAKALDIENVSKLKSRLKKDGVTSSEVIDSMGRKQQATVINEPNLYRAIMSSRKKEAVEFQDWIVEDVIPAIRKHGGYLSDKKIEEVLTDPDTIIRLATALKEERSKKAALERELCEKRPKALFADSVAQSSGSILVGQFAKLISGDGFKMGQNRLFRWLREHGYLHAHGARRNQPYQRYIDNGWFEVIERTVNNPDGSTRITLTTKITGKGQVALAPKILDEMAGAAS